MEGLVEGRIVHYILGEEDTIQINRRRVPGAGHSKNWSMGAQAHVGNPVVKGEHYPAIVVKVWLHEFGDEPGVNLQVFLDGNDSFWALSKRYSEPKNEELGTWHWIEKA